MLAESDKNRIQQVGIKQSCAPDRGTAALALYFDSSA